MNYLTKIIVLSLVLVLSGGFGCIHAKQVPNTDEKAQAFKIVMDPKGKYWFEDTKGNRFLSIGINNIVPTPFRPRPDTDYYAPVDTIFGGNYDLWKQDVLKILENHGFNTLGSWSDGKLYDGQVYGTICLYVAGHNADRCLEGLRPDFKKKVRANAQLILDKHPDLDMAIGFFLDNEMAWYGKSPWDALPTYTLLELAFDLPKEDPAKEAAKNFLMDRYTSIESFSKAWGREVSSWENIDSTFLRRCLNAQTQADRNAFTAHAAEMFFSTASEVVRQMFPGKLILGVRFAMHAPEQVIRTCGKYCDVISFNDYRAAPKPDEDLLAKYWIWGGKRPLMVTEYSWRAEENASGNPNTGGAGTVLKTQAERGACYKAYVEELFSYPMVIGAHWFEFADQSPQGRFDGENSNYGIVDIRHRPYKEVLKAMAGANGNAVKIHADSKRLAPEAIKKQAVTFQPGQHPDRPPFIDLLAEKLIAPEELYNASDAKISLRRVDGVTELEYDTAQQWGCGAVFFGPEKLALKQGPKHATDLDGYSYILLDAEVSDVISFELFVDEAGVGPPHSNTYDLSAGDDGESFTTGVNNSRKGRHTYRFEIADVLPRTEWGNQNGRRKINTNAMKGIGLFLHGGQGKGTFRIHSLKLAR
jgi:hypothetical protein